MNGQPWFQAPTAAPKLAQSEEAALVLRWRDEGDVAAGARVVSAHLPYVMRVASKFRGAGLAIDDLIAEGCLGLLHAMTKYEPDRGLRLLTYATHWIHAYLRTAVTRAQSVVSGDVRARMTYVGSIRSRRAKLEATLKDDDAIDAAVAAQVGMPVQRVREIARRVANPDASLDDPDASARPLAGETSIAPRASRWCATPSRASPSTVASITSSPIASWRTTTIARPSSRWAVASVCRVSAPVSSRCA